MYRQYGIGRVRFYDYLKDRFMLWNCVRYPNEQIERSFSILMGQIYGR